MSEKRMRIVGAVSVLVAIGSLSSCDTEASSPNAGQRPTTSSSKDSGKSSPSPFSATTESKCTELKTPRLKNLRDGLRSQNTQILQGYTVPYSNGDDFNFNITHVAAVRVRRGGETADVVLAVGSAQADGPVFAAGPALDWFNWGDLAKDDSPVGKARTEAAASEQADEALGCLG